MKLIGLLAAWLMIISGSVYAQVGSKHKKADERVVKLLDESGIKYTVDDDGDIKLIDSFDDNRSQIVWIMSKTTKLGSLEVRKIFSLAYRTKDDFSLPVYRKLLEENAEVKVGAWGLARGKYNSAIFTANIDADTDALSLLLVIHAVATTADEMEKTLSGKDDY